jgi:hypothetical protein
VKFEALVELSREAEGKLPRSLQRNVSKVCFGVHTRDLATKINLTGLIKKVRYLSVIIHFLFPALRL